MKAKAPKLSLASCEVRRDEAGYGSCEQLLKSNVFSFHLLTHYTYWPATASYSVDLTVVSPCCSEPYREKRLGKAVEGWITFANVCKCCQEPLPEWLLPRDFELVFLSNEGTAASPPTVSQTLENWVTRQKTDPFVAQLEAVALEDELLAYCVASMERWGWAEEIRSALGSFPES